MVMSIDPITKRLINRECRNTARHPLVLMYHGTTPGTGTPANRYSISACRFEQQIDFLQEYGWSTLCVRDLHKSGPLPIRSVLITFDDGYRNNFQNAFLPLVERGMRATWFIVSSRIGRHAHWMGSESSETEILESTQLREMAAADMEIGSHTSTHPDLTAIAADLVKQEIHSSKDELEGIFGFAISSFAYPYGRHNDLAVKTVNEAGYSLACGVRPGLVNTQIEPYQLRRVTVFADDSLGTFARKLVFATNDAGWRKMTRYAGNRVFDRLGLVAR
jgi:peptidoglycan/xylan/chitin deacetylase (PgdA/CDA1 family)